VRPTLAVMKSFPLIVTVLGLLLAQTPARSATAAESGANAAVPVLMYHVIADPPPGAAWPHLFVSPAEFAAQVTWLKVHGFEAVTLAQMWRHWHHGAPLPKRPVVLSFDDGYHSVAAVALPILAEHDWAGVLNLKVGNVGEPGGLTERQVRRLLAAGWELGAHTITHPDLRTLDDAGLEREVRGSRAVLRRRFGVPVDFFCYPAGRYDDRVVAAVRRAGFLGATTTDEGLATRRDPYRLKRVRVSRGDGVRGLASALPARSGASPGFAPGARASGRNG
jgi:peptidoglycan/xylan/chitin deacetylase (PgdA/CDA1 family)